MTGTPDLAGIEHVFRRAMARSGAVGAAAVLVWKDRVRVLVHGQAAPGQPVKISTPFHVCSCSKTFTAAVFSRLVADGTACWEQPVHEVLPEFAFADPWVTRHCTFRDLACMRVGLSRTGIAEWGMRQDLPREERLARARHMDPAAPFREGSSYSNLCYIALALAAERLAAKPYPVLLKELLCMPLELLDTWSAGFGAVPRGQAALPHLPVAGETVSVRELTGPNSEGSARIHLSARDAGRWLRFLLDALNGSDAGPLSSASVRAMAAPQALVRHVDVRMAPERDWCAYGMGLSLTTFRGQPLLRHGGGGRGWRHAMALAPDADVGVMVMAAAESPAVEGVALQLLEGLMGAAPQDWSGVFTRAAQAAAASERKTIEARFPARPGVRASVLPDGHYSNAVTGDVQIESQGPHLRMMLADAPDFSAALTPLGGDVFELDFLETALARQPLDPPFRLRLAGGSPAVLETSYFGTLRGAT